MPGFLLCPASGKELSVRQRTLSKMKRLFDLFRKQSSPAEPLVRQPDFFCLYCNAKFPHDDLERVAAHLKPHKSRDEAEARLIGE